ncbi:hypothetical protein BDZ97DRAFT_1435166 [Flammula alnicola]|nr:hypothetical protein BDZ97DRAFT_1435166 [Flammula alnicola]
MHSTTVVVSTVLQRMTRIDYPRIVCVDSVCSAICEDGPSSRGCRRTQCVVKCEDSPSSRGCTCTQCVVKCEHRPSSHYCVCRQCVVKCEDGLCSQFRGPTTSQTVKRKHG